MTTPGSSFGVLAQTVATAGTLIAAASALTLCWKGRFSWEPAEEDVPKASQKFGGLFIAIFISIMWFRFTKQKILNEDDLIWLSITFGIIGLIALIFYSILVGVFVYEREVAIGKGKQTKIQKIVGGFWLTSGAKNEMRQGIPKPTSVQELYKGSGYKTDAVWSKFSRSLAKTCFSLTYIFLIFGGTCALTAISLIIASTIS